MAIPPRSTAGTQSKQNLLELAQAFLKVPFDDGPTARTERENRISPLVRSLSLNTFRLVVMGEVKKGKSSFINALLNETELLPTAIQIATSTVFKILYGPTEKLTVFFLPGDDEADTVPQPLEITRDRLREFGTEDGNPNNTHQVDFIAIELPHPLLSDGIVIVDTPGVGGLFKRHRDVTFRYAPQADVVFFVLDSAEAVISQDELDFLKELRKHTQRIVFLQTKIDIAGLDQVEAWKRRNLEILSTALEMAPKEIPYLLVGAQLKQYADRMQCSETLAESGYPQVMSYLREELIPRRDEILTRRWLPLLGNELLAASKLATDRLNIARQAHLPQLAEYETRLVTAEREFERWLNEDWPRRLSTFQDKTSQLKRETRHRLQDAISPESPECQATIEGLRIHCQTSDQVNETGDRLLSRWAERWNNEAGTLLEQYRRNTVDACEVLLGGIAADLQSIAVPDLSVDIAHRRVERADQVALLREAALTSSALGGIAGEAAKWIGFSTGFATLALGLSNPVGWAIAAGGGLGYIATRVWGAVRGYNAAKERQRDAAVAAFERALLKTGTLAARSASRVFENISAELDSAARTQTDAFRARSRHEFTARRQEIMQAKTRTTQEARLAEDRLKGTLGALHDLLTRFQKLKQELAAAEGGTHGRP